MYPYTCKFNPFTDNRIQNKKPGSFFIIAAQIPT